MTSDEVCAPHMWETCVHCGSAHSNHVAHGDLHSVCWWHFVLKHAIIFHQGNVLIDEEHNLQISDFGLSSTIGKLQPGLSYLEQLSNVGAVRWAAPQQLSGCELCPSGDIYSFACIMFEVWLAFIHWWKLNFYVRCCLGTFHGWKKRTISRLSLWSSWNTSHPVVQSMQRLKINVWRCTRWPACL